MSAFLRAAALGVTCTALGVAQPVLAPALIPAAPPPTPPPLRQAVSSAVEITDVPPTPWHYGPLALRPHLETRLIAAHDLPDRRGNLNHTTVREFSPGLRVDVGERWLVDAAVTWTDYSSTAYRDTFGQTARLAGYLTVDDWHVHFAQSYLADDTSRTETGRQTRQEMNTTALGVVRALGENWSSETTLTQENRLVVDAPDARERSIRQGFNWKIISPVILSGGLTVGLLTLDPGADLAYVRPAAQLVWQPGPKLAWSLEGGAERRWRASGARATRTYPVGALGVSYRPFPTTELTLRAQESLAASYFENQLDRQRRWTAGLQQRLLEKIVARLEHGEDRTYFLDTSAAGRVLRRDVARSWQLTLSARVLRRGRLGLFWRSGRNHSSGAFDYHARQTGAAFSFAY